MKLSNALLTLASLALANVSTALPKASPAPSTSSSAASTSFASTSGLQFTIDGETGYFAGTNSYWIGFLTDNADVDLVMGHLKSSGLKILRVWGFNDVTSQPSSGTVWYQLHENGKSTINTGADGLQRLDYVVSSAEQHDIKLIINFVNYWTDYGGMSAYVSAYGGSGETDFYTSDTMQSAYQTYIKTVVERYSNSSAVFAWELANEPRCPSCDTSVLYNWIEKTSKFIKGLDADRMVCIGDEGFGLNIDSDGSYPYQFSEGLNFTMNLGIDTIDFGTLHLYPDSWGTSNDWGNGWITAHGAACKAAGKPCLLEEYGVTSNHCSVEGSWQKTALSTTGVGADLFWQYGDDLSTGKSPDDGNTIYYGTSDYQCLVTDHVAAIGSA